MINDIRNKKNLEESIDELRTISHKYLEKYNASKQQLRIYLLKKSLNKKLNITNKKELLKLIDIVISTLEEKKILNDQLFSDIKTKSYLRKGYSLNKIRYSLIKKGIADKYIKETLLSIQDDNTDTDLFSAMKTCKRRRIGPIRNEDNRTIFYKKDIGILARSGFSHEISKKVLSMSKKEFEELYKII